MEYRYALGAESVAVSVQPADGGYTVTVGGRAYAVTLTPSPARPGEYLLTVDGVRRTAWVAADGPRRWVALDDPAQPGPFVLAAAQAGGRGSRGRASGHEALEAQMPGVVRRVLVAAGASVERGQALVLLEAMKMEIRVTAPHAGTVEAVRVAEGQSVERGQTLVELQSAPGN